MISIASSIKFYKNDGLMESFDNTPFNDRTFRGGFMHRYYQKVYDTDTITVQVKVTEGQSMEMQYSENCWGPWTSMTGETKVVDGATYDYYHIAINFSTYSCTTIKFKAVIIESEVVVETWTSEDIKILSDVDDNLLQIEFFNLENANDVDYVTAAISHILRVEGQLKEMKPGGEMSVFDNQNEVTKIKDEVKRFMIFKTEPIPLYLCEMLRVALSLDKFFINEVEFVADSLPDYDNNASNLAVFTATLIQKNVIGLNTHDIGFDVDAITGNDMTILQELAASGQKSFAITADHMILSITGERVAGSPVLKAGSTPGGSDILFDMSLVAVTNPIESALIPVDKAAISGGTLYVTVSGVGATANIYVATFKNRQ